MYFQNPQLEKIFTRARVIIFDLNGLMIDDEKYKLMAFNAVLKKFKIKLTKDYWISQCIGYTELNNFKKILAAKNIHKTDAELINLIHKQHQKYQKLITSKIKSIVRPGILKLIKHIKTRTNKKLALATSTNKAGYQLILGKKGLNILQDFDYIVCGEEIKKSKPDPEIYLKVLNFFKLKPDDCLVFEDASTGVAAAKNAEMKCVVVPSAYTIIQDFSTADIIISSCTPLAKVIM